MMHFSVLSLFPEAIQPYLSSSILGRASSAGLISIDYYNIRDYSLDKHRRVDDTPFGGGYGMLMAPQPIFDCHAAATEGLVGKTRTIYFSPAGQKLDHQKAMALTQYDHLILLCGHYEGVDQRVIDSLVDEEISVGDYVLTGGELPCAILIDAVSRLIEGVLPDSSCYTEESIASGLLEYPQYTKPAEFRGKGVPEVLRGGNHADIVRWRREKALEATLERRPDLLDSAVLSREDLIHLEKLRLQKEAKP